MNITITVSNKIATITSPTYAVCDNTDYTVVFTFDSEWTSYTTKTARFAFNGGHYDAVFTGNSVAMPKIENADMVLIGVFAGDLHTTTPAKLPMVRSILHSKGGVICPSDHVYDQVLEQLNHKVTEPTTEGTSGQVLTTDGQGGRSWTTCEGTTDHAQLEHLAYADSGHTGFQATIDDLATIRSGAALGATALQSVPDTYRTSAEQDVIDATKVDKVTGKGLSTEDYTTAEKTKLAGVESGADVTKSVMTSTTATAWTDSEKAAARARMSAERMVGEWSLLNSVTTKEDTSCFVISADAQGNPYSLYGVKVRIKSPPGQLGGSVYLYVKVNGESTYSSEIGTAGTLYACSSSSPSVYRSTHVACIVPTGGQYFCYSAAGTQGANMSTVSICRANGSGFASSVFDNVITGIYIYTYNVTPPPFVAGTTLEIYGIKKVD